MRRGGVTAALILICAVSAVAQGSGVAESPTQILFISSTISLDRIHSISRAMLDSWRKREPKAEVLAYLYPANYIGTSGDVFRRSQETLLDLISAREPKVIVAHGNDAVKLVLSLRAARFPRTPIITLEATNNVIAAHEKEPNTHHLVMPRLDLSNFKLAYRLFPKTKRAVLLIKGDNPSVPPAAYAKELTSLYPDVRFEVILNPTPETVDSALVSPQGTVLIAFTPGWRHPDGRYVFGEAFLRELAERYTLPVFTFIRDYLGSGMVGGTGITDVGWGRAAAELGQSLLLDGRSPPSATMSISVEQAFVDYRVLRKFGVSHKAVPEGAEIVNMPPGVWDRYRREIQATGLLLVFTIVILTSYLFVRRKERKILVRANEELEGKVEERTRELQAANDELSFSNENLVAAMRRAEAMKENVLKTERAVVLGRFAAGLAHNLNTPLGAIRSANETLLSVVTAERAGLFRQMMAFGEKQAGLFERCVDRVLARVSLEDGREFESSRGLETELAGYGCRNPVQVAADLFDSGLTDLGQDERKAFAEEDGAVVASALFRISVVSRSCRIVEAAVEKAVAAIDIIREYGGVPGEKPETTRVDLPGTIAKTLEILKSYLPKTIVVVQRFQEVPPVLAPEQPLIRLWSYLIMNAVQAMPDGGRLCVALERENDKVLVHIEDDGVGIPDSIRDSLFDPFVTTRPLAEAMGLGLAYCKKIVEDLSGTIGYLSKKKGTIFTVSIPVGNKV